MYFNLESTNLMGTIPEQMGNLGSLIGLNLGQTSISGTIPNTLDNLGALTVFSVFDTAQRILISKM